MFIDVGNTNTKILSNTGVSASIDTKNFDIKHLLSHFRQDGQVVIASVVPAVTEQISKYLEANGREYVVIDRNSPYSFNFSIEGIGVDRLLAVEGALTIARAPLVVVDAGTAITVDFVNVVNNEAVLEGGVIIPGFGLGLRSLNDYTAQLPVLDPETPKELIGRNTKEAMLSGVYYTIVRGIEGLVDGIRSRQGAGEIKVFITGGAASVFRSLSLMDLIYDDQLVFKGMKNISRKNSN